MTKEQIYKKWQLIDKITKQQKLMRDISDYQARAPYQKSIAEYTRQLNELERCINDRSGKNVE